MTTVSSFPSSLYAPMHLHIHLHIAGIGGAFEMKKSLYGVTKIKWWLFSSSISWTATVAILFHCREADAL